MQPSTSSEDFNPILCFAHRGEAKTFLTELPFKPVKGLENTYQFEHLGILTTLILTGEGSINAISSLGYLLGRLQSQYPERKFCVFNLGICGLLRRDCNLQIGDCCVVRTCYAFDHREKPSFKSYNGNLLKHNPIDCMTSPERVIDKEFSERLSHFAHIVDRESHGIGLICDQFNIPFSVIKCISDNAEEKVCKQVKDEVTLWSDLIYKKYLAESINKHQVFEKEEPIKLTGFHITVSQERTLRNLFKACSLKGLNQEKALQKANISKILERDCLPKDKTKALIEELSKLLNPIATTFKHNVDSLIRPLEEAGLKIKFEQNFETDNIYLNGMINNNTHIEKMILALKNFEIEKVKDLFRGKEI